MRKTWRYFEKGEIATIITIGTLIFLGVSTLTSSLLLKNNQTSSAKAATTCSAGTLVGSASSNPKYYKCAAGCGLTDYGLCLNYEHNSQDKSCSCCGSSCLSASTPTEEPTAIPEKIPTVSTSNHSGNNHGQNSTPVPTVSSIVSNSIVNGCPSDYPNACCVSDTYTCPDAAKKDESLIINKRIRWYGCTIKECIATEINNKGVGGSGFLEDCKLGVTKNNPLVECKAKTPTSPTQEATNNDYKKCIPIYCKSFNKSFLDKYYSQHEGDDSAYYLNAACTGNPSDINEVLNYCGSTTKKEPTEKIEPTIKSTTEPTNQIANIKETPKTVEATLSPTKTENIFDKLKDTNKDTYQIYLQNAGNNNIIVKIYENESLIKELPIDGNRAKELVCDKYKKYEALITKELKDNLNADANEIIGTYTKILCEGNGIIEINEALNDIRSLFPTP